jgi:hypothetical protein
MIEIYHLQKRHPDAGEFRIWSLLANDTIAVRTVSRVMALNWLPSTYVATYEAMANAKRVTPALIQRMCVGNMSMHTSYT